MARANPHSQHPPRKNTTIPILLLFSLLSLFFYSYSTSRLPFSLQSNQNPSQIFSPTSSNFTISIKVLAFDRIEPLRRCLGSISRAHYGGDRVNLHIFLDHFKVADVTGDLGLIDRKIKASRRILDFVDGFYWSHGEKVLHYRTANAGLQGQWIEAWWPCSDGEFAFIVEDDLELSPFYYMFLRNLIKDYYFDDSSNFSSSVFGASLQRPRFVPGKHGNKLQVENGTKIFLYQLVGTWGQLLFPRPWKEFRLWYDEHKSKGIPPLLEGMVTNGWYKKMREKIWTPWFIKFVHSRGYFNIYAHFDGERALSISHRDAGVNYGKTAGPDSILLDQNSFDLDRWKNPPVKSLKWYDFCFREVRHRLIIKTLDKLGFILNSVHQQRTVILVSLLKTSEDIARNLLCHFQRLNISNYVLFGASSELLVDLARTGHAAIDLEDQNQDKMEFYIKSHVLKRSLELGFSAWLLDAGHILPIIDFLVDSSVDFLASSRAELFYARCSASSAKAWNAIIPDVLVLPESRSFIVAAQTALEKKGFRTSLTVDHPVLALTKLDDVSSSNSSTLLIKEGKRFVYWTSEQDVVRSLSNLGLWLLDGDSSCAGVYCHQS